MNEYIHYRGCPFCGRFGYNLTVKTYTDTKVVWCECADCGARGPAIRKAPDGMTQTSINAAIAAWNARPISDKIHASYAALNLKARKEDYKNHHGKTKANESY